MTSTTTTPSVRWAWERAVRDDANLSRNATLLALTLATYMSTNGKCRPSKARLTRDLRFTNHKSLEPCRAELRKAGYLAITRHMGRPTEYRATMPNPLASGSNKAETETTDIANVLSQPANQRVSQPANQRSRTDQRATDQKPKELLSFEGDEFAVVVEESCDDGGFKPDCLTNHSSRRSSYPNISKVVDADGNLVAERRIDTEAQEVSLIALGLSVYRIRGLEGVAA